MRDRDSKSFFADEEEEVERLVFTSNVGEEPRPKRAQEPAPRPKPSPIASSRPGERWIPGETKDKKKSGRLKGVLSTIGYGVGLLAFIGGIYWVVIQVASVYTG